ncbi:MAG TPA: hypothetical protein VMX38_07135 [Verrucomicrobiae bacterium]|jgi:hypothetical protein|nr:hypothetical protein [Verrucomicrobiae bacterium]
MTGPENQRTETERKDIAIAESEEAFGAGSAGGLGSVTAGLAKTSSGVKENVQGFVLCTCERAVHRSKSLAHHARESAARMREEKALQVIAIVASAAFLLGVASAAWKTRN